jgi:hypothetical protein
METRRQRRERKQREAKLAALTAKAKASVVESNDRRSEVLNLIGFACGLASFAWSVIAPNSSATFGSVLLLAAVSAMVVAIRRMWSLGKSASACVAIVAVFGFIAFDWYIVVQPQRGKPFQTLLVHGYHLTSECGSLPARQQMPTWLRDESKQWQVQVEQLVTEKLPTKDSQLWHDAIIIGLVTDENMVAYQCTWLATKVGALEAIISTEYDPNLKHRDYTGPTYWFEAVNGKVDISEALKAGHPQAAISIQDFGATDDKKEKP